MTRLSRHRPAQVFSRIILPLALFVAVVGGIAWLTQNLPNRQGKTPVTLSKPAAEFKPLVKFDKQEMIDGGVRVKAIWDPKDPDYAMEYERDVEGHYDYSFANISDSPLELGLNLSSCDCMKLEACAFPADEEKAEHHWIPLAVSDTNGIPVPVRAHGIVRVGWKSKKNEGLGLNLAIRVWCQPQGATASRQFVRLETPVVTRPALMFDADPKYLGSVVGQAQTQLIAWSATREKPVLIVNEALADPCFACDIQPLTAEECRALEEKLKESRMKVKAGFRLNVSIREERDGKFLDQGHFEHRVPLKLDGEDFFGPALVGRVSSDILVGSPEDGGKIQLKSFNARDGIKKVIPIRAQPEAVLTVKSCKPESFQVKLEKSTDSTKGGQATWNLEIIVPPGTRSGSLPDDSVLILHSQNAQSRLIRIPILGLAFQG